MTLVSIILPVRNGARTLDAAVDSCLRQTHSNLELLLIDDASTDATPDIIRRWTRRDPRVPAKAGSPAEALAEAGVAEAFQRGLQHAKGAYIARMDADDLNHPDRLQAQVDLLQRRPEVAAVGCLITMRKRTPEGDLTAADPGYQRFARWLNGLVEPEAIAAQRFVDQPVVNPSMMVRREVFHRFQGYRSTLSWAEDYDFWLRLLEAGEKLAKVPRKLFTWIDHPDRLTRTDAAYQQQAFLRCKAHYLARLPEVPRRGVALCGAGPIGKAVARALLSAQIPVHAFYEVHPGRIGQKIHGIPVEPMDRWGPVHPTSPIVLGAVGQPGKRAKIRTLAAERGHREGIDYFALA